MAKVAETFNVGDRTDLTPEKLLELIEVMYTQLAIAVNSKPDVYQRGNDGQATDVLLANGDININTSTNKVEMLVEHVNPATVVWEQLS